MFLCLFYLWYAVQPLLTSDTALIEFFKAFRVAEFTGKWHKLSFQYTSTLQNRIRCARSWAITFGSKKSYPNRFCQRVICCLVFWVTSWVSIIRRQIFTKTIITLWCLPKMRWTYYSNRNTGRGKCLEKDIERELCQRWSPLKRYVSQIRSVLGVPISQANLQSKSMLLREPRNVRNHRLEKQNKNNSDGIRLLRYQNCYGSICEVRACLTVLGLRQAVSRSEQRQ